MLPSIGWNEARLNLKKNQFSKALNVAELTFKLFPDDIEGMVVFGICLRANNKIDQSLKILNKVCLNLEKVQ